MLSAARSGWPPLLRSPPRHGPFPFQPPATGPLHLLLLHPHSVPCLVGDISTSFSAAPGAVTPAVTRLRRGQRGRSRNLRVLEAGRGIPAAQGGLHHTCTPSPAKPAPFQCFLILKLHFKGEKPSPLESLLPLRSVSITALIWLGPLSGQGDTDGVLIWSPLNHARPRSLHRPPSLSDFITGLLQTWVRFRQTAYQRKAQYPIIRFAGPPSLFISYVTESVSNILWTPALKRALTTQVTHRCETPQNQLQDNTFKTFFI